MPSLLQYQFLSAAGSLWPTGVWPRSCRSEREEGNPCDSVSSWAQRNAGLLALLKITK